jgi:hypothetical protein
MRVVRGEPERGDDRGALARCRVTQCDEALVEPHLDAGGAADRDGVERAPAGVLAVVQLAQRGAGQPDGLRGNGAWPQPDSSAVAVKNRTGQPPSGVRPGPRNAACEVPAAAATARRSASVAAGSSSVTAVGLPPRPSRRTHASTTVTSGQDIGPPLTLNEPATANGDRRTWPQRPTERVPERTGLPQPVPSCTG